MNQIVEVETMKPFRLFVLAFAISSTLCIVYSESTHAQIEIVRAITYEQITNFETNLAIQDMKISADGSIIVFSTSGGEVKVYTIGIDGSNLTEVYDFQSTGFGPWVDISSDGNTIIWCDRYGEIFVANRDGTGRKEIATLLPNPNPDFVDITPSFPVPPRINAMGTEVFFLNAEREAIASGLWKVDIDGTNLRQIFDYTDFASDVFGTDASEYNRNIAFTDGFDISANGDFVIFGSRIFQLQDGEMEKGDAIVYNSGEFYYLSTFATGNQPFATYVDGDQYMLFRREDNPDTGIEEINLYALHLAGGAEIKIIEGLKQTSYPQRVQMTASGARGIVLAGGGLPSTPPITFVSSYPNYYIDLVNIDDVSIAMTGSRMSEAYLPSINALGNIFCFLMPTNPTQIWVGRIKSSVTHDDPSISNVLIEPTEVLIDGTSSAHIEAKVQTHHGTIHKVAISAFKDGEYIFRSFTSDWPWSSLVDDGTVGDAYADDYFYSNSTIRADLPTSPLGEYTIRIAAGNTTMKEISAADFRPLSLVEELTRPQATGIESELFDNILVSPNPFKTEVYIDYSIHRSEDIIIEIYNSSGQLVTTINQESKSTGQYRHVWKGLDSYGNQVPEGIYICKIQFGENTKLTKLIKY